MTTAWGETLVNSSPPPSLSEIESPSFDPTGLPIIKALPDPFLRPDGSRVTTKAQWVEHREYLIDMLTTLQYGDSPPKPQDFEVERTLSRSVFNDLGVEEQYLITLSRNGLDCSFRVALVRPQEVKRYPAVIKNGYTFFDDEPYCRRGGDRIRPMEKINATIKRDRFAAEEALKRGYLLCKFMREDLVDDYPGRRNEKLYKLYPEYSWGAIAAWAWTYQIVIDFLDDLGYAEMDHIVATGHSRGGKTALWAGIIEPRIAISVPSASGAGGTSSLRFSEKGKSIQGINHQQDRHGHWWAERWFGFRNNEYRLPYDAHTVRSLMAPRPLLNTYGREDFMTNPYGAQVAHEGAKVVYDWLGVPDRIAMHWRQGGHAQAQRDWRALFDFVDWHFYGKQPTADFNACPFDDLVVPMKWKAPIQPESTASRNAAVTSG